MTYEELLSASDSLGLITREKDLQANDGLIKGRRIAIRQTIPTSAQKACVLAEELGHYFTTSGDIRNMDYTNNRKQERRARIWAHDVQVGLDGILAADAAGCRNLFETADFLDVPEEFLWEALKCYKERYGSRIRYKGCIISLDPVGVIHEEENRLG